MGENDSRAALQKMQEQIDALNKENKLYRTLIDQLPLGIQIFDDKGFSFHINETQKALLGLPDLSTGIGEFNVLTDPFSKKTGADKLYEKAYSGESFEHTFQYDLGMEDNLWETRKDAPFFKEKIVPIKNKNQDVEFVLTILENISDEYNTVQMLKESEIKFKTIFNTLEVGLTLTDKKGKLIDCNPASEQILGITKEEHTSRSSIDEKWKIFRSDNTPMPPEEIPAVRVLKEKRIIKDVKMGVKKGDELVWLNVEAVPLDLPGYGAVVAYIDITQLKKKEEELQEVNRTKDKVFSIISHDLRSPYNATLGFSEMALMEMEKENYVQAKKYIDHVFQSAQQGYALLNNILQWSRIQTGTVSFEPESFELKSLFEDIAELFNANASKKDIKLEIEVSQNARVFADQFMLETILRNLISNAVKFTNNGGEITVCAEKKGDKMRIGVSDTGVGISPNVIENLFASGNLSITAGTNNETGTGLGLVLCKEFVEKHNSKLEVKSEIGKGTKFWFDLPGELLESSV